MSTASKIASRRHSIRADKSVSSTTSVCVEPALILEEAAREFEEELLRERENQERSLDRMLDQCWEEMVLEMRAAR